MPAGKYVVKIDAAKLNRAKSSGRVQCSWELTIVSGEQKGRKVWKHDGLNDDRGRSFFRATLNKLGVEWPGITDLPDTLDELLGSYAQITGRQKEGYDSPFFYFDKAVDSDDIGDDDADEYEEDEDEEEEDWGKGDRCVVEIDGDDFAGKVVKIKGKKATVKFDDGDKQTVALADLQEEEDEDDDEEEEEEKPKKKKKGKAKKEKKKKGKKKAEPEEDEDDEDDEDEDEDTDEDGVEVTFDDEKLSEEQCMEIGEMGEAAEFDPDDYDNWSDLLCDVAEYVGVSGEFKKPATLFKAIKKTKKL